MNSEDKSYRLITWLLRIIAASICSSFFTIFLPLSWMNATHRFLGLGRTPTEPIFEYLTRSLSAMYFAHGFMVFLVSTDVRRYWPMVKWLGVMNLFLGAILFGTDCRAPMPLYWTCLEGPPIIVVGSLLLWLSRRVGE